MREIKFRAWDKMNGFLRQQHMIEEPSISQADIKNRRTINDIFKDDDFIFMQYTGLKDKNGVEIYEGDICIAYQRYGKCTVKIIWEGNGFYTEDRSGYFYRIGEWALEIVGNIYDNPELLEVDK